uniref:PUM-HD domain-containing protein n=2 Tax=Alexandrium monilatum TaxID=311494 RepID=A0A6T1C2F7_9DINO
MVCASGLTVAGPVAGQITWAGWSPSPDWLAKGGCVASGTGAQLLASQTLQPVPGLTAAPSQTMQPVPGLTAVTSQAMQPVLAPTAVSEVLYVPVIFCRQQQERALPPHELGAATGELTGDRVPAGHVEDSVPQSRLGLSTSAQRRLRRKRAAQRRLEAQSPREGARGTPAETASPRSAASEAGSPSLDCDALAQAIRSGGDARDAALASLRGAVAEFAFDREGCRVVQAAIQAVDHAAAAELLSELHGRVRDAIDSPHANYVIQAIITTLPTAMSSFVVRELIGWGGSAARHRFGCRVLCRLIEHSGSCGDVAGLLGEVVAEAEDLCRHPYAHYVIESLLEHLPEHHRRVVDSLRVDLPRSACSRCASHVLESALLHCSEPVRQELAAELLGPGPDAALSLAQSQHGARVLQAVLRVPCGASQELRRQLSQGATLLEGSRHGRQLLQEAGLGASFGA